MKKVFAIALAIIMTLSVVLGCSGKKETPPAKSTAVTQQQQKENGKVSSSAEKDKQRIDNAHDNRSVAYIQV